MRTSLGETAKTRQVSAHRSGMLACQPHTLSSPLAERICRALSKRDLDLRRTGLQPHMLDLYRFLFALGGVLLLASMFIGGEQDSSTADGPGSDLALDDAHAPGLHGDVVSALTSIRFWTFGSAFFGLTGWLMDGLDLLPGLIAPLVAATAMGLSSGWLATKVLRTLNEDRHVRVPTAQDYVGKSAKVLLPLHGTHLGKVRLVLRGTTVDVLAKCDGEEHFVAGDKVLIISLEDTTAVVVRDPDSVPH